MPEASGTRGSYQKGRQTRREIVEKALEMFSRQGYRATSIREIAREVGLTQSGLMHHFESKEQLLMEVIKLRDANDNRTVLPHGKSLDHVNDSNRGEERSSTVEEDISVAIHYDNRDDFTRSTLELIEKNESQQGLVRLFAVLAGEATDPEHPAHDFFATRYRFLTKEIGDALAEADSPIVRRDVDPYVAAQLAIAAMDGLQTQWLMCPEFDMKPAMKALLTLLTSGADSEHSL